MDIHFLSLTVCFEPPFWVGVFERIERGARSASRIWQPQIGQSTAEKRVGAAVSISVQSRKTARYGTSS